jgi:hypothetical protein
VFDLNLYPLYIKNGTGQPALPGLRFLSSPKNSSRIRSGDQIVLLASPAPGAEMGEDRLQAAIDAGLREYFQSTGTVTSGMNSLALAMNNAILDFNIKEGGSNQSLASLNLVVLHSDRLYIGHAGPTHSFVLSPTGSRQCFDPESGPGLGLSRNAMLRFFLGDIGQDEFIIFSPDPQATWTTANLGDPRSLSLEFLKRRLLNQLSPDVRALLIQVRPGNGRLVLQQPLSQNNSAEASVKSPTVIQPEPATNTPITTTTAPRVPNMANPARSGNPTSERNDANNTQPAPREEATPTPGAVPVRPLNTAPSQRPTPRQNAGAAQPSDDDELSYREALQELGSDVRQVFNRLTGKGPGKAPSGPPHPASQIRFKAPKGGPIGDMASASGSVIDASANFGKRVIRSIGGSVWGGLLKIGKYFSPGGGFKPPALPPAAMILISVAIPLLVVVIAASMYMNRGKTSQYDFYLEQAKTAAAQTATISDPTAQKNAWQNVIDLLDMADRYGSGEEADTLRAQALNVLDDLSGIARIEFEPAIVDGLPGSVNITRMLSSTTELYLLDSNSGQILRAVLTGKGYELDPTFNCAPGPFGSYVVDAFVDFTLLPKGNSLNANLAAVDGRGNLVYCTAGDMATSMTLISPDTGWGEISSITYDSTRLYILDVQNNSLYIYQGGVGSYINKPESFFDQSTPAMQNAAGMAINGNDLYLLYEDGHMAICTYSQVYGADTKCKDPSPYAMKVNGDTKKPVTMPDSNLTQLQYSQPPDPSIYMLDSAGQSLYHFSLRLSLQKKLAMQSGDPFRLSDSPATAFTVNPGKVLFIAFGNKVFTGVEP